MALFLSRLKGWIQKRKKKTQKNLTCLLMQRDDNCTSWMLWFTVRTCAGFNCQLSEHLIVSVYLRSNSMEMTQEWIHQWKCVLNDINKVVWVNLLCSPQQSSKNNEQTRCVGGAQACTTCQVKVKEKLICSSSLPRQHPKFVSTTCIFTVIWTRKKMEFREKRVCRCFHPPVKHCNKMGSWGINLLLWSNVPN